MSEKSEEFIVVCCYCKCCYGNYTDEKKTYFQPIKIALELYDRVSHGICPECHSKILEQGKW